MWYSRSQRRHFRFLLRVYPSHLWLRGRSDWSSMGTTRQQGNPCDANAPRPVAQSVRNRATGCPWSAPKRLSPVSKFAGCCGCTPSLGAGEPKMPCRSVPVTAPRIHMTTLISQEKKTRARRSVGRAASGCSRPGWAERCERTERPTPGPLAPLPPQPPKPARAPRLDRPWLPHSPAIESQRVRDTLHDLLGVELE